jgi:hypothetical protein
MVMSFATSSISQEMLTYEDANFFIQYPKNWTLDNSKSSGTEFMIFSPLLDEEDQYQDFFKLTVMPLPGQNETLEHFSDQHVNDIKFFYQDSKFNTDEYLEHGGKKCRHIQFSGSFNGFGLAQEQYIWFFFDQAYILTYTAESVDYWKLRERSKEVFKTFRFKH